MTPVEFKQELKNLRGGYFFCGEEDYLKKYYFDAAAKAVMPDDDVFNRVCINRDNYSPETLMSAITALPVMAERKLIEVTDLPLSEMTDTETDELISVLSSLPDYEYNVLLMSVGSDGFDMGTPKQPSKTMKKFSEVLKPVVFAKETPARLASWCAKHFSSERIIALPDTVSALLDRCGCDMYNLSSEIAKLCFYLKQNGRDRLTVDDVVNVASESKEIAAFDFANAILDGKTDAAISILNELEARKEKPEIILSGITRVVCDLYAVKLLTDGGVNAQAISSKLKMHEYKAKLYVKSVSKTDASALSSLVKSCYDADIKIKSTPLDSYAVLDRLAIQASLR